MACLYISQKRLDAWNAEDRVTINGNTMVLAENGRSFEMVAAVRFMNVVGDQEDPHDLIGKVSDEESLAEMGADHMATSVIYGNIAYEVECGFLGNPLPPGPTG